MTEAKPGTLHSFLVSFLIFLFAASMLGACQSRTGPEEEIRQLIASGEEAVENNEIGKVRKMIADSYTDDNNRTKRDIISLLTYHTLKQKSIYLLQVIVEILIHDENSAELSLFVAMTGRPIENNSLLPQFQADIYHFTISVTKDGNDWLVTSASWQPAVLDDFQERLNDHENT